jgi:hypothetical protein
MFRDISWSRCRTEKVLSSAYAVHNSVVLEERVLSIGQPLDYNREASTFQVYDVLVDGISYIEASVQEL